MISLLLLSFLLWCSLTCLFCFWCQLQKSSLRTMSKRFFPLFFYSFYRSFLFKIIHFNLYEFQVYTCEKCQRGILFSQHHFLKRLSFPLWVSKLLCWILVNHICESSYLGSPYCSIGLCVCSYTIILILFEIKKYVIQFCNTIWNQEVWCLQQCFTFTGLLWLFGGFTLTH